MKKNLLIPSCITIFLCYTLGSTFYVVFDQSSFVIQLTLKVIGALIAFITIIIFQSKSTKSYRKPIMYLITVGFIFALFGDYFLAYANKDVPTRELFFPFGIAAYLIGYTLFGISFYKLSEVKLNLKNAIIVLIVTIPTSIFYIYLDKPKELIIPLLAYALMMILLLSSSFFIFLNQGRKNILFSIAGFFYYISDIIIGFKEFSDISINPIGMEFLIIITFVFGHIFMILGIYNYTQKQ